MAHGCEGPSGFSGFLAPRAICQGRAIRERGGMAGARVMTFSIVIVVTRCANVPEAHQLFRAPKGHFGPRELPHIEAPMKYLRRPQTGPPGKRDVAPSKKFGAPGGGAFLPSR